MKSSLLFFSAAIAVSVAHAQPKIASIDLIRADNMRAHLEFLAHDLLEGRDTPSRGLDIATLYVASQLKLWGVTPAGDKGGFWQDVPLTSRVVDPKASSLVIGLEKLTYGDFMANAAEVKIEGQPLYVGNGWQAPELGIDPYAGIDLKGRVLIVRGTAPIEVTRSQGAKNPDRIAQEGGAAGVVRISTQGTSDWNASVDASLFTGRPRPAWQTGGFGGGRGNRTNITLSAEAGDKLLEGVKISNDPKAKAIPLSKQFSVEVKIKEGAAKTQNVVGIIPGTDPKLSQEYVGVSAHIDHVGMRVMPDGQDGIFNGADDDGSGSTAVLELAHAFAAGKRPKRSIIFIWHIGEEKGLWGSDYFSSNPTVPLNALTALINIDMIGRSRPAGDTNPRNNVLTGPEAIYVVGSRRLSTELGDLLSNVNSKLFNLKYDYKYDDPNDRENIYQRSDHINYANKGVPIAFYFDGVHEDYHQVGDEVQKIDFTKMEKVTKTVYASLWELANRKDRVKLDKPFVKPQ